MALNVKQNKAPFTYMVIMRRGRPREEDRREKMEVNFALFINLAFSRFVLQMSLMSSSSLFLSQNRVRELPVAHYANTLRQSRLSQERLMRLYTGYSRKLYIYIYDSNDIISNFWKKITYINARANILLCPYCARAFSVSSLITYILNNKWLLDSH